MKTHIYTLHDEHGVVRYVGKTSKSLKKRLAGHLRSVNEQKASHRVNWIRSILAKGFLPTIRMLESVNGNGSKEEKKWIAFFRSVGVHLVNATDGGEGTAGLTLTKEHRRKISKALMGMKRPESTRAKMRGRKHSEATRAKIRAARAKQPPAHTTPHTEEAKRKMRKSLAHPEVRDKIGAANRGKKRSPRARENMSRGQRLRWGGRKVRCVETGKVFSSNGNAAAFCGGDQRLIARAVRTGIRHKGLHWEKVKQ